MKSRLASDSTPAPTSREGSCQSRSPRDSEAFATGGEHSDVWRRRQDDLQQRTRRTEDVFAIVDDEQQLSAAQMVDKTIEHPGCPSLLMPDPEGSGEGRSHPVRIVDDRQFHQPGTLGKGLGEFGSHLQREACLARSPHTGDRDQSMGTDQVSHLLQFALPTDEGGELQWKIVIHRFERPERWEVRIEAGGDHLVQALGFTQILQAVSAEIEKFELALPARPKNGLRRFRNHDLTAVTHIHDAGGGTHGKAEDVVSPPFRLPRVQPDPHA
jgi:hypothetical protein